MSSGEQKPWRSGDLQSLPWADDTFDVVTGFNSFFYARIWGRRCARRTASRARAWAGKGPISWLLRNRARVDRQREHEFR